jgi:hypothetical protein
MPLPVTKTYYLSTGSYPGTTYGGLLETAPPNTNTTWGWIVGQNTPPNFAEMNRGIEIIRNGGAWRAFVTQSAPNQTASGSAGGNGWMMGPINGEFVPGRWQVTMSVKSTTSAAGQDGRFIYRIWTCASGSGAIAALVTSSFIPPFISSSLVTNLTTTPQVTTTSIAMPQINLHGGYIFFHTNWSITGASTNNGGDVDFVMGSAASVIRPTGFVTSKTRFVTWSQSDIV